MVLGIVVVVLLWGPSKLPELAKALGRAKAEFEKATEESKTMLTTTDVTTDRPAEKSSADALIETAKKLGISTEGKTKEQISAEIVEKADKSVS